MHLRRRTYGILTEMCKYILESLVDFGTKLETGEPVLIKIKYWRESWASQQTPCETINSNAFCVYLKSRRDHALNSINQLRSSAIQTERHIYFPGSVYRVYYVVVFQTKNRNPKRSSRSTECRKAASPPAAVP